MVTKEEVVDLYNQFGTPFYFEYHHGVLVMIKFDLMLVGQFGELQFELNEQLILNINPGYVTFERTALGRPDNLIMQLDDCLLVKQNDTGEVLGWLCWPQIKPGKD